MIVFTTEINDYHFHIKWLPNQKEKGIISHSLKQVVVGVSFWDFPFSKWKLFRFQNLPPLREAIHSWLVRICWFSDSTYDEPAISVKDFLIFHDAQHLQSRPMEGIKYKFLIVSWYIDRRLWDPGIANLRRINESVQEEILCIITNIKRRWSFFHEKIAKNDDLIILGLILERERNGFNNPLASKASVSKASWKFTSLSFFLIIGYVFVDVCFDLLSSVVYLMYQLLYTILN